MAGNTEVGRGYVQLEINGDGMNEGIVDAVDSAGPGVGKAGEEHGETYGDGFEEGFFDRITNTLSKHLEKELDRDFKNMGRRLGNSLSKSIGSAVGEKVEEIEDSIARMLDNLENRVVSGNGAGGGGGSASAPGGVGDGQQGPLRPPPAEQRYLQSAYKANEDMQRAMQKSNAAIAQKIAETRLKIHEKNNADIATADEKAYTELVRSQQALRDTLEKNHAAMVKENASITQKFAEARVKLQVASNLAIEKDDERLIKAQQAILDRAMKENEKRVKVSGNQRGMGDTIGRLLGAGSRNNAFNLIGRSIGGTINLVQRFGQVSDSAFRTFQQGASMAGESAGTATRMMSGASAVGTKMFGALAAGGPAAALGIGVTVVAASVLVSVLGALLALATALVSTIASGLVGALAVGTGGLIAMVAAGGLLTAAFMSMTDAQKALLKDAFVPLREEMTGLGQIMIQDMIPAFGTWSENLQKALLLAEPVARVMGKAFAEAGTILTESFSGPGFQAMSGALAIYLPSIITRLSAALGSFLNGAMGMFAAIMPFVDRFAAYLARTAETFSRWANSAEGQNKIVDFVSRAVDSLQSLWNAVREVSGFIGDVLFSPEAQGAGNSIFDGIARTFAGFRQQIAIWAADGTLQKWFDDAIQFGSSLWGVMESLWGVFQALYSSGVLEGVGGGLEILAFFMDVVASLIGPLIDGFGSGFPSALSALISPLNTVIGMLSDLGGTAQWAMGLLAKVGIGPGGGSGMWPKFGDQLQSGAIAAGAGAAAGGAGGAVRPTPGTSLSDLISRGRNARSATGVGSGGTKAPAVYKNPYKAWAESLIKDGPSISKQIKDAMKSLNKQVNTALADAAKSTDGAGVKSSMAALAKTVKDSGKRLVESAQSALNSAAQSLASASSAAAASKALKEVKKAQKDLEKALKAQDKLDKVAKKISAQGLSSNWRVKELLKDGWVKGATMADFARAREAIAIKISEANEKLANAIAMRDDYRDQVTSATKSFGALTTAQAQTVNGVEQALTYTDITSNLQARLDKIRTFQSNLRLLLAQGLSDAAYKQIVDAGVDEGSAYADALVQGGQGAVQQVNGLVSAIDSAAGSLGVEASNRLYQAGVSAAQGLVDGLNSLSAQLDSTAAKLGASIAASLKKSLGIRSPSTVMYAAMGYVGDGIEEGLDAQHDKVGRAANRLSDRIQVSPVGSAGSYSAPEAPAPVSGNDGQKFRDLIIQTPTDDPRAVALEVLDEVVERL